MPNILNQGLYRLLRREFGKVVVARAGEQAVAHKVDYDGKNQELKASGLLATCVQHEIDHLNGMRILDRMRDMTIRRAENKIGRNQLVTIKKGDAVKVLKYKKTQKFLNQGWTISD